MSSIKYTYCYMNTKPMKRLIRDNIDDIKWKNLITKTEILVNSLKRGIECDDKGNKFSSYRKLQKNTVLIRSSFAHSFRMRIAVKINSTSMDSSTPWFTSNPVTQSAHFTLTSSSLKRSSISNAHKEKQKSTLYSRNASQSSFVLFKNRLKN